MFEKPVQNCQDCILQSRTISSGIAYAAQEWIENAQKFHFLEYAIA